MRELNDFDRMSIHLASPEKILSWSYGEVKKPETINYRSLRPEKDGLFCEKIFGTTREWECYCGKYKSIRYKGVVCDRCGVEVAHFKVRRERMGHIQLASPVAHIWFYKSIPSRIGLLLNMTMSDLKQVIYFEKYIVVDKGETDLEERQLLTEEEYLEYRRQYGIDFVVSIGAEAIKMLLERLNLRKEEELLRKKMHEKGDRTDVRLLKRLEAIHNLSLSGNNPSWMILSVLPVVPPEIRPMVQLDGGRFATSDLNELYRRVVNRNNRLKRLIQLGAPDIIIRNEKRMLQEAVDALLDNSKRKKVVKGPGNRPLKAIADMLKGKQGRFRQNLLGKRVDYSGRSVVVIGPKLKLYQCGLPKKMALELFRPFIMMHLIQKQVVYNIKGARKMIEDKVPLVWNILEEVIKQHPVLLNRAPTLHRLGIQAFEPLLVEGDAIHLHPLVCSAFNADFDGDQMAVHVPLSNEAQIETWVLMLAPNNMLNPANGEPIVSPTKDMVLGIYFLTQEKKGGKGEGSCFSSFEEVLMAMERKCVELQSMIQVYWDKTNKLLQTTPGRILFNLILPSEMDYVNQTLDDKQISTLVLKILKKYGNYRTVEFLDEIKKLGFEYAKLSGLSIGIDDIRIPLEKEELLRAGEEKIKNVARNFKNGYLTEDERYNQVIDVWTRVSEVISSKMMSQLEEDQDGFNSLYVMAKSGARGSKQQIRQLAGMRGLMAKPSGEILELPILSNFKEGLLVLEYFISTHGARKGLADTALKTADAGYLTRRLVDIAQDVVVSEEDCGTINGLFKNILREDEKSLMENIVGRYSLEEVEDSISRKKLLSINQEITESIALEIQRSGVEKLHIRTVVTCESESGICQKCYGKNLATDCLVEIGTAVGIIAAQSIGQPGTQLTMRTFHIGGTAARQIEEEYINFKFPVFLLSLPQSIISMNSGGNVVSRKGEMIYQKVLESYDWKCFRNFKVQSGDRILAGEVLGQKEDGTNVYAQNIGHCFSFQSDGQEKMLILGEEIPIILKTGSKVFFKENSIIQANVNIVRFDPYNELIIAESGGIVEYNDIIPDVTLKMVSGQKENSIQEKIVTEIRDGSLIPRIAIINEYQDELFSVNLLGGSHILVEEGQEVKPGDVLAKITRAQSRTKDITGGLPRISELFEARKPKNSCILGECDGIVRFGERYKGKRIVYIEYEEVLEDGTMMTHQVRHVIPHGQNILVFEGDYVHAGDKLCDGLVNPHDLLKIENVERLQEYLVDEIQEVYKLQGVNINDKHVGVIIRQMLRKVSIVEPGDTDFIVGQEVNKFVFKRKNDSVVAEGGKAATARAILQGITKASLNIDSFISAASFQETTKVLTNAALSGSTDYLKGIKENVIIGHLIPAGTGLKESRQKRIESILKEMSGSESFFED